MSQHFTINVTSSQTMQVFIVVVRHVFYLDGLGVAVPSGLGSCPPSCPPQSHPFCYLSTIVLSFCLPHDSPFLSCLERKTSFSAGQQHLTSEVGSKILFQYGLSELYFISLLRSLKSRGLLCARALQIFWRKCCTYCLSFLLPQLVFL
jgi:hypothetical protein